MKHALKHALIALALCAIPAMAGAQTVTCNDCTHEVSVYTGQGGFVAQAADGAEMVTYVSHCGGITMSGQIAPDANRLVAMLFTPHNGLSCNAEGARLELGPIMDGGWYWITQATNSAVGSLVNQSILDNPTTTITHPGHGVTMTPGRGEVLMREAETDRVGILPNILPQAPMPGLRPCGYDVANPTTFTRRSSQCALGDGGVVFRVMGPVNPHTGARTLLQDGATVVRPRAAGATFTFLFDVWGNGSGHYTTDLTAGDSLGDPRLGHPGGPPLDLGFLGYEIPAIGARITLNGTLGNSGLAFSHDAANDVGTLTVGPSTTYCGTAQAPLHHSAQVLVQALVVSNRHDQVTPPLVTPSNNRLKTATLTVACP